MEEGDEKEKIVLSDSNVFIFVNRVLGDWSFKIEHGSLNKVIKSVEGVTFGVKLNHCHISPN